MLADCFGARSATRGRSGGARGPGDPTRCLPSLESYRVHGTPQSSGDLVGLSSMLQRELSDVFCLAHDHREEVTLFTSLISSVNIPGPQYPGRLSFSGVCFELREVMASFILFSV